MLRLQPRCLDPFDEFQTAMVRASPRSTIIKSGVCSRASDMASLTVEASAHRISVGSSSITSRNPRRTMGWSSTTMIRWIRLASWAHGVPALHIERACRSTPDSIEQYAVNEFTSMTEDAKPHALRCWQAATSKPLSVIADFAAISWPRRWWSVNFQPLRLGMFPRIGE